MDGCIVWERISRRRWRRIEWEPGGLSIISVVEGTKLAIIDWVVANGG